MQHVGDRAQAAVQQDVAGLGQRLLLQLDDVFEGKLTPCHRPDELQALGLGEDQQRAPRDVALEDLMNRHERAGLAPLEDFDGHRTMHEIDGRHGQMDLLADHLAKAEGGTADADVDELRQSVELQLVEHFRDR